MAPWGMQELLLRQVLFSLQGANWQRGGGKGQRPKPVDLPDKRKPASSKPVGAEIAQKLRNLGLIPPGTAD